MLFVPSWTGPYGEEHRLSVGEHLRPPVAHLTPLAIDMGELGRHPAGCSDLPYARRVERCEVNGVVSAPRAALCRGRVAQRLQAAADRQSFLELALREEADPSAVGREERQRSALGSSDGRDLGRV